MRRQGGCKDGHAQREGEQLAGRGSHRPAALPPVQPRGWTALQMFGLHWLLLRLGGLLGQHGRNTHCVHSATACVPPAPAPAPARPAPAPAAPSTCFWGTAGRTEQSRPVEEGMWQAQEGFGWQVQGCRGLHWADMTGKHASANVRCAGSAAQRAELCPCQQWWHINSTAGGSPLVLHAVVPAGL